MSEQPLAGPDYPAAHSMDAHWFAVDRDGHVALFKSGESGAVPTAATVDERYQLPGQIAQAVPPAEPRHDLGGRTRPGLEGRSLHAFPGVPLVMFLESVEPVQEAIAAGRALPATATQGVAVVWPQGDPREFNRLHEEGLCLGCFVFLDAADRMPPNVGRHGLFVYGHLTDNWISGPYGREQQPARPIHVDELPPRLRQMVRQFTFENLRFADATHIQPVEHAECASWEEAWLDVTGRHVRPMPGREQDYAERYRELAQRTGDLQWEPPPDAGS